MARKTIHQDIAGTDIYITGWHDISDIQAPIFLETAATGKSTAI